MSQHKASVALLADFLRGDWWTDDRRNWCAYCGIRTRRKTPKTGPLPPSQRTRDHVIAKAHGGGHLTIPACRSCNTAKGATSLPEFLLSPHFATLRSERQENQWSESSLWLAVGLAAIRKARALAPPAPKADPPPPGRAALTPPA